MKKIIYIILIPLFFASCGAKDEKQAANGNQAPTVTNNGSLISFHSEKAISFFDTETIGKRNLASGIKAPGKIVAGIFPSGLGASQNVILFDNPELAGNYTQLVQHQINIEQFRNINIPQKEMELARVKNLQEYGAATGQDLMNAETGLSIEKTSLANARAALIEHETALKSGGFRAELLQKAKAGTVFLMCDIPESQIGGIDEGQLCDVIFTAFPGDTIKGKVDAVADQLDNTTRMLKVRILINNASGKLKTGMFANVSFETTQHDVISVSQNALITVQGEHYVFVKKSATEFERRQVQTGQQIDDRVLVYSGLQSEEQIAIKGVMQLKGLSFGY